MSTQHTRVPRPSRTYKDGIGKPVVKKVWDNSVQAHRWDVVFPPCNSFGEWIVEPEAKLVHKAWQWCFNMNWRLIDGERAARAAIKAAAATLTAQQVIDSHRTGDQALGADAKAVR